MTARHDTSGHDLPPDAPMSAAELADLYAAGALSLPEAAAFEKRVALGDPEYVGEFERVKPVLESLLAGAGEVAPPPHLRAGMAHDLGAGGAVESPFHAHDREHHDEELVGAGVVVGRASSSVGAGIAIARLSQGRWYPTGIRGVRFRQLHAGRRENRRTIILQMDPGTALPDHDHVGTEEVIMLSGDLSIAGTTLGPGDYINIAANAKHGIPRTTGGCTCMVVSGYQPFPLKSWFGIMAAAIRGAFKRNR